ncbi:hypothetical protein LTR28_011768, partial [Elasticomyces elasticus]
LPSVTYLGFSAETGELSDNHDIISVETKNLYSPSGQTSQPAQKEFSKNKGGRGRKEKESGGWFWFILKFLALGIVIAGAWVGFTMYRANKRKDRF